MIKIDNNIKEIIFAKAIKKYMGRKYSEKLVDISTEQFMTVVSCMFLAMDEVNIDYDIDEIGRQLYEGIHKAMINS